jgi:hypothetical protein
MKARYVRSIMLTASIMAMPVVGALAQTTTTTPPPTADQSRLGTPNAGPSAMPYNSTPGGTGKTVVPGNNSTVSGDRQGTAASKAGGTTGGAADGGGK